MCVTREVLCVFVCVLPVRSSVCVLPVRSSVCVCFTREELCVCVCYP